MIGLGTGRVLSFYIGVTFLRWILGFFVLGTAIIFLADAVELIRRTVDRDTFDAATAVLASFYKTPSLTEEFLPFAVLFGAIAAFLALNRRLELAVMRGAGISAWQFVAPAVVVVALIGVVTTTLYNPISAAGRERSDELVAEVRGTEALTLTGGNSIWFRQDGRDGPSIMHASAASANGLTLYRVEAHLFDQNEQFTGRLEAATATLGDGAWWLNNVTRYAADGTRGATVPTVQLATALSAAEVHEAVARADATSFWKLPAAVQLAQRAGLPAHRFALQYQVLLARPLLLAAMVLIAASVSLRMVRLGGVTRAIAGGVVAGFGLYIASAVASDLGEAGAVPPVLAAWLPGLAAALFGATALLYSEDG
ncbi:LPS export ABC transporter permease LptG [Acuticoccus sp. I52.16.1]|uniref:LPS export ABC transporter permease LptG n=1 Tax=Acuticoccus sp. I52.16.1 TaxID=2928472 RepID=UPI001FD30257|nr:LPS export ABC transporter permease LptG [Acuticoccus sp. I52.16.1]UOM35301.1 LPS export ABC transporter permease LptG [Acuticoccus sp. I52.16.1]